MKKFFHLLVAVAAMLVPFQGEAQLVVSGKPSKFLDMDTHLLLGGSYVTQNYKSCYSQITDVNNSMGFAWGLGFGVKLNFTSFVALGTEINYLFNSGDMDLAITGSESTNVSNVFIRNRYRTFNIPVFISFDFNLAPRVKWNVDGGLFFTMGSGGSQKATIYNVKVNDLGQLMMTQTTSKAGYYNDSKAFINSYRDFDYGLHLATGLTLAGRYSLGLRGEIGFRNVALSDGLVKPSNHNITLFGTLGYHF